MKSIFKNFFPNISSAKNLSALTHLSEELIFRLSKHNYLFYKNFEITVKRKKRIINCPSKKMKVVQSWIQKNILEIIPLSAYCFGFRKGLTVRDNALNHISNKYLMIIDIKDFFPSITYNKVYNVFKAVGYEPSICHILTSICTYENKLPIGAPSSPALSNIICYRLDMRIAGYAGIRNITYSRYADDLCFSSLSPAKLVGIKSFVEEILKSEGFILNEYKTRFSGPAARRKITGMVLGNQTIGVGRVNKRLVRAKIHHFCRSDISKRKMIKLENEVNGWLSYLNSVDTVALKQLFRYYKNLIGKYGLSTSHTLKFPVI